MFPIGKFKKSAVREIARKFKLPNAEKKDSQGICFIGRVSLKDFLKKYIKEKRGDVLNEKNEVIGYHDGIFFLTIGQRHGFTITKKGTDDTPYYIVKKDVKKNTVTVAHEQARKHLPAMLAQARQAGENNKIITITKTSWVNKPPMNGKRHQARFRHLQQLLHCSIAPLPNGQYEVIFVKPQVRVASGQSLVIYDGKTCLGGGIVE